MGDYDRVVPRTAEFHRIMALRRRVGSTDDLILPLSASLRKPHDCARHPDPKKDCGGGAVELNPFQCAVLCELHDEGGVFAQGPPGIGKTLATILAPELLQVDRAVLFIPGSEAVREKTVYDIRRAREHWRVRPFLIESYEKLTRVESEDLLFRLKPKLIVFDECHRAKDQERSVSRRVERYLDAFPDTKVMAMSGTPAKRSFWDFAHVVKWCLREKAPVPLFHSDISDHADYLDGTGDIQPGALHVFGRELSSIRRGYREHIFGTPGCVASQDLRVDSKLEIQMVQVPLTDEEDHWFRVLKGDPDDLETFPGWTTPDGHTFTDAVEMWAQEQRLALDFYQVWDPRPPADWAKKRRRWHQAVRSVISSSDNWDTSAHVAQAVDARKPLRFAALTKHLNDWAKEDKRVGITVQEVLAEWREAEPTFRPTSVPFWGQSLSVLKYAADWMKHGGGVVWTMHRAAGYKLSEMTGLPYFGAGGMTDGGRSIVRAEDPCVIASVQACGTGLNLQRYDRMLVLSMPPTNTTVEQTLARIHRQGQKSPVVHVDWVLACSGQERSFRRALQDAEFHRDMLAMPARLCYGDIHEVPIKRRGWAWIEKRR